MKQAAAILMAIIIPNLAFAGVGKSMQDFWDQMGGYSNYTGADSYKLQSAGYYSMGGIYARTPTKSSNLAAIQMPSLKAGCGGINLYNGGFSYINADELTQTLKAIANNSSGFAMQLALETISPVIAEKVEEMQAWIQRINAMNINSCETAATLVGGMWPRQEQASQTICSTLAGGTGVTTDYVSAKHGCHTDRKGTNEKIKGKNKDAEDLLAEDVNIAWKAIKKSGLFNDDQDLAEVLMTLSGTIIIHAPNNNEDSPKYEYISGKATSNEIITVLLDGGPIKYHMCDDKEKCLNVTRDGGSHEITDTQAFKAKIEKIILGLIEKIKKDEEISDEEKSFLKFTANLPLYKILNVYAAYSGAGALFELPTYSEAIALQMLFEYLDDVLSKLELASNSLMIASDDQVKSFKNDIREARKSLAQREIKTQQNYATIMSLVDKTMTIEGILAKNLGSPIADAFQWQKRL
jgi:conjugative transfer pilus assembly protein TraH